MHYNSIISHILYSLKQLRKFKYEVYLNTFFNKFIKLHNLIHLIYNNSITSNKFKTSYYQLLSTVIDADCLTDFQ